MIKLRFINKYSHCLSNEGGISLVELLVVIGLLSLVMTGITGMLITSIKSQQKVDAQFRSQLDVRQALYDMESNIAEAKRKDSTGNQPIFGNDLISFPSQKAGTWITYIYGTPPGAQGPTIVRIVSSSQPTLPITLKATDKQMINVNPNENGVITTVERVSGGPIFTYYGEDGSQIFPDAGTKIVTSPRDVRSVKVQFQTTVSEGHADREPTVSSTQINLRNF